MTRPRTPPAYRRLTGRATALVSHLRLWQGDDHLLLVECFGYTERYKRFYYRDIEALLLRPTPWRTVWSVIWSAILLLGLPLLFLAPGMGGQVFGGFLTALAAFGLVVNFVRGPTCACTLQTRVNRQPLTMLNRVAKAERFLARIQPMIEQAQGTLAPPPPDSGVADIPAPPEPSVAATAEPPAAATAGGAEG